MRYLEWSYDSDPDDQMLETQYAYIMRERDEQVTHEHDSMKGGLFSMPEWEELLGEAGFQAHFERVVFSDDPGSFFGIAATQLS